MNITDLRSCLPVIFKTGRTPHLVGHKGVGKSSLMQQLGKEWGYDNIVDLRIGQISDVAELQGLPIEKDGMMTYARPWWMPTKGKTLIVLDEINRATKDVVQGVFQLVYDKQIGPHKLGADTHIIALSNPPTDDYITLDFSDEAFQDRFVHIKFEPTISEFKEYLLKKHGKKSLMNKFLEVQPELVTTRNADDISLDFVSSSNRSTDYFMTLEAQSLPLNILKELSYGILGTAATVSYFNFLEKENMISVTASEVIEDYKKAKKKIDKAVKESSHDRSDIDYRILEGLTEFLTKRHQEGEDAHKVDDDKALADGSGELTMVEHKNIKAYLEDVPTEMFIGFSIANMYNAPFHCTIGLEPYHGICTAQADKLAKYSKEIDEAYEKGIKASELLKIPQIGPKQEDTNV